MGAMVDGIWQVDPHFPTSSDGGFVRPPSTFRDRISADPEAKFYASPGRYHLIVSLACPWAHRTLIARALYGLDEAIPVAVVHWFMADQGWTFAEGRGVVPFRGLPVHALHEVYAAARAGVTGRVTVPVLWDTVHQTIVNNESSEILRFLGPAFRTWAKNPALDLAPAALVPEIDAINSLIYDTVNNGVYKSGFARSQAAYEHAVSALFSTLDSLESRLSHQRWLVGDTFTEADVRLFTTLVRFDAVYVGHFKCNLRRLVDYPALWAYTREIATHPAIAPTIDLFHIQHHYYESHAQINPTRIVPAGPVLNWQEPHDRGRLGGRSLDAL
jgi:putative glutathione S-transferase